MIKTEKFIFAVLFWAILFCGLAQGQGFAPASVYIVAAKITTLAPVAWVSGTVVSRNDSQIAAEVSGRLIHLSALGSKVKKGDVIAQLDDTPLKIQQRQATAEVASAQSSLRFMHAEVKRSTALATINLTATKTLEANISALDIAKADLVIAQARLANIVQQISFTQLKAPFTGLVVQRLSNKGEYIKDGTAIIRIVETANVEASVFAPLSAYRFLQQSKTLAVESSLGSGQAAIKTLIPVAHSRSHLMQVRLDMTSFDWPIGLNIKVAVANGDSKSVLAVPRDALVLRRDGASVFRINTDNKAEQIKVTVGIGAGDLVQIIGDVKPDDRIVVRGAERLQPGQVVQINPNNQALISSKS
jgi:RND family efflux transporter MFP subunit